MDFRARPNLIKKENSELQEQVVFNCFKILDICGFEINDINLSEVVTMFELDGCCGYCGEELKNGVCEGKHYLAPQYLINSYTKFLDNHFGRDTAAEYLKTILNNLYELRAGNTQLGVTKAHSTVLLKKMEGINDGKETSVFESS